MARNSGSPRPYVPFEPEETTPLDLYTPAHGNILAMMADSGKHSEEPNGSGESIQDDHSVAASLPVDPSVVNQAGHMDHHRKPIISIHGKDVDEHEFDQKNAA